MDEDLLDTYARLFKAKDGWAVVGLIDGACQGCHMRVTKSTELDVRNENVVTHCQNCGRLLYWWTDEVHPLNPGRTDAPIKILEKANSYQLKLSRFGESLEWEGEGTIHRSHGYIFIDLSTVSDY